MKQISIFSLENYQLERAFADSVMECVERVDSIVDRKSSWKIRFLATQLMIHAPRVLDDQVLHSIQGFLYSLNENLKKHDLSTFEFRHELFENVFKDLLTSSTQHLVRHRLFGLYHTVINPLSKFESNPEFAHTILKRYIHSTRHIGFS